MLTEPKRFQAAGRLAAMLMLAGFFAMPEAVGQGTNPNRENVLFAQQDQVTAFNLDGGGQQIGVVTGKVSGTSVVNFQFTPTSERTTFSFDDTVVITDLDGDQLKIRSRGTWRLITQIDPSVISIGGPLVGTYEVLSGTGKYVSWTGKKFPYRGVAGFQASGIGTVYGEVLSNPI